MKENLRITQEPEPVLLKDIPRPYSLPVELADHGNALLIDNKIILSFKNLLDERAWKFAQIRDITKTLLVARERTLPIVIQKDGTEFMTTYEHQEDLKGRFGTVFIYERSRPRVFFIGENYEITFQPTKESSLRFIVDSVSPIRTKRIANSYNYDSYLEELAAKSAIISP
jgi:hypothetical protein